MSATLKLHKVRVKPSPVHGHGVFAETDINPGEIIEECYMLILEKCDELYNYTFKITKKGLENRLGIPLGFGMIYNHSNQPNAYYEMDEETSYMVFTAIKPIKAGEEIFTSYGDDWFAKREIPVKQTSWRFKLKKLFVHDVFLRRALLITAAIGLFTILISK